jgi:hypothetical protein
MRYLLALFLLPLVSGQTCSGINYGETVSGLSLADVYTAPTNARYRPIVVVRNGDGWHGSTLASAAGKEATTFSYFVNVLDWNVVSVSTPGYATGGTPYLYPANVQGIRAALGYIAHWANSPTQSPGSDQGCTLYGDTSHILLYGTSSGTHDFEWLMGRPKSTFATACTYCDSTYNVERAVLVALIGDLKTVADFGTTGHAAVQGLLGCDPDVCVAAATAASFTDNILPNTLPPIAVSTGSLDGTIGAQVQYDAVAALHTAGARVMQRVADGYHHPVDLPTNDVVIGGVLPAMQPNSYYTVQTNCNDIVPCGPAAGSWPFVLEFLLGHLDPHATGASGGTMGAGGTF